MESMIRDISLAESGQKKIDWVKGHMPLLNYFNEKYAPTQLFKGINMVVTIHLEAKTAYLALTLKNCGANVTVTGSNPLSTQDDVAAALVANGITVFATHACTNEEYDMYLDKALDTHPQLIVDDGGDLVNKLHTTRRELIPELWGGSEETTTGVIRLRALAETGKLAFPMIAVNDSNCKYLFDNRYGTGQSVWDGIMRTSNLIVAGKTVVVAGYGWCGKGVAMRAKGMGARVIVTEVDPIKGIRPHKDLAAVHMRIEINAFLFDLTKSRQREHLKSTGIRQDRFIPDHKLMQSAQLLYNVVSGTHMKMIGIGQLHLCPNLFQILCRYRSLNGRDRSHIHKHRCLDRAMHSLKHPSFGSAVCRDNLIHISVGRSVSCGLSSYLL